MNRTIARIWTGDVVAVDIVDDPDDPIRPSDHFPLLRSVPTDPPPPYHETPFTIASRACMNYLEHIGQAPRLEVLDPSCFVEVGAEEVLP